MKYRCIDNQDVEELLTLNKEYKGERFHSYKPSNFVKIFRCEDKKLGYFKLSRFVEIPDDTLSSEPEVKINSYSLMTD